MTDIITKTTHVRASIDRVWQAVSDYRQFGEWFRVALDQPFEAGRESTGRMTYPGYEGYPWRAQVVAVEPPHRLAYEWVPGADGKDEDFAAGLRTTVEFRLEAEGDGTRVTITESGFDRVPEARRESAIRDNSGGWDIQSENLRGYAEASAEA